MAIHFKGKILKEFEYPYATMLYPISDQSYPSIETYVQEFEKKVLKAFDSYSVDYITFPNPDRNPIFSIERDNVFNIIPNSPTDDKGKKFLLVKISSQYPVSRTLKPSGFMFNDYSFLQIEQTLAWSGDDKKLYLLKYSYHYGRTYLNEIDMVQEERYHFRYEKESDYEYKDGSVNYLNFKPMYHFHGNSKDPHFKEPSQPKNIEEVIETLSINISRLQKRYGACSFLHFPAV
ncbi:hypothetical protein ACSBO6_18645 [Bacillus sp. AL-1R]